uniref:PKD_channel domain-containing protein n=1 Tax=Macrostomum lignano TaxID=282301 RepID=A0A1I8F6E6_9PLAT
DMTDSSSGTQWPNPSLNVTTVEYQKPRTELLKRVLSNRTDSLQLYDQMSLWAQCLANLYCTNTSKKDTVVTGLTGDFLLSSNGSIERLNWRFDIYRGLLVEAELAGRYQQTASSTCLSQSNAQARERRFLAMAEVIDFTASYLSYNMSLLYTEEPPDAWEEIFLFSQPYDIYTWLGVLGATATTAVVVTALHRIRQNNVNFDLLHILYCAFSSLCRRPEAAVDCRISRPTRVL